MVDPFFRPVFCGLPPTEDDGQVILENVVTAISVRVGDNYSDSDVLKRRASGSATCGELRH